MKTIARILLIIVGLALLGHYLPRGYWLLAAKRQRAPIVFYSCVDKDFLFYRYNNQGLQMVDSKGTNYDRDGFEALLPLDNYLQLLRDGKLPKSIDGVPIPPEAIKRARLNFKIKPILLDSPVVPLNPLLESQSGRVRLEMPEDFMRLGKNIEFLNAQTNTLEREKTELFAKAFSSAGFVFPALRVDGNPTTLKGYDEGYFLVDATGATFQLKQVQGQPDLHRIADVAAPEYKALWQSLKPRYVHVQEQDPNQIRAIVIDQTNRVHLVIGKDYKLVTVPIQRYDPDTMVFALRGDLLNRLVTVTGDDYLEAVVLDREYGFVSRYTEDLPLAKDTSAGKLARALFPFTVEFDDENSGFLGFIPGWGSVAALGVNAALLVGIGAWLLLSKQFNPSRWVDLAAVGVGGIYGVILTFLMPKA
jgi:hypothetical protein